MHPKMTQSFQTTLGDFTNAVFEEALAELGDERLAQEVTDRVVLEYLRRDNRR